MANGTSVGETKFIYYIDEEETPYLVKLNIAPEKVTLGDFKNALNRPHSKFFFKSLDDDFGVVKEEIFEDNAPLPCFNGRVVSWVCIRIIFINSYFIDKVSGIQYLFPRC
ncbi:unnamed protein product [Schistosoma curassoni]|uniref:DIX domain-containing protein n=1 Tax=Schistosoma curassoni TaxID=6186 RepID=A0A183L228_9TREM|nr:unnamed protein product [Schistosoma curassoni]